MTSFFNLRPVETINYMRRNPLVSTRSMRRVARTISSLLAAVAVLTVDPAFAADADGEETTTTAGTLRVHWDYPAKASVGLGVVVAKLPSSFDCHTSCLLRGLTVQGAAGLGGGELAIGYGSLIGETGRGDWLLRHPFVGYGVRAAAVRTWGASTLDPHGETYVGVEGGMVIAQFGLRLGVFRRAEPIVGEKDWRVFAGAGWGF
jgi:hypothetical protein